jgi:tRNA G18 (ribose-2'-O)-methylase SpoU
LRRRYEQRSGTFVVEGERAIERALGLGWELDSVLLLDSRAAASGPGLEASGATVLVGPLEIVETVTGFRFHRGALAIARRPQPADPRSIVSGTSLALVVEAVNDHENMGSLFRNAAAFGAGAVLLDPTSCDPLYRRSVRVSMGHALAVPFATLRPWPAALADLSGEGFAVVALTPGGDTSLDDAATWCAGTAHRVAAMVGSEVAGLSRGALEMADVRVRVPMAPGVDSLNVATAAAIALSRLRPRGGPPLV